MVAERSRDRVIVLSRSWFSYRLEAAYVMRSTAGALSRTFDVEVAVPGPPGAPLADGFFDLKTTGDGGCEGVWPEPTSASWPSGAPPSAVLIEWNDDSARRLAAHYEPDAPIFVVSPTAGDAGTDIPVVPTTLRMNVPVNPLASLGRHNGLGFTNYLLVLADRLGTGDPASPPAAGAWLAARFPARHVVVVADAVAAAWFNRSLRGWIHVDTRTDLQRLMAHAQATVDLAPGSLLARECIESMRLGTPVIVPSGTVAARLAARGGGLWYQDVNELLGCAGAMADPDLHSALVSAAKEWADRAHGEPSKFVTSVSDLLKERRRRRVVPDVESPPARAPDGPPVT